MWGAARYVAQRLSSQRGSRVQVPESPLTLTLAPYTHASVHTHTHTHTLVYSVTQSSARTRTHHPPLTHTHTPLTHTHTPLTHTHTPLTHALSLSHTHTRAVQGGGGAVLHSEQSGGRWLQRIGSPDRPQLVIPQLPTALPYPPTAQPPRGGVSGTE